MDLRVVRSSPLAGDFNMALDWVLANQVARRQQVCLRMYRWSSPSITVGRTVPSAQALAAGICYPGSSVFRRPTGGGVLFHADQMSFSLSWPRGSFDQLRSLRESYYFIHRTIGQALAEFGVTYVQVQDGDPPVRNALCASTYSEGDLVSDIGSKVLGGAQWRASGSVLYQGHLWLRWMPALEESIAFCLAQALGVRPVEDDLNQSEHEAAEQSAASWRLEVPASAVV